MFTVQDLLDFFFLFMPTIDPGKSACWYNWLKINAHEST